ncbi:putative sporulation protein YtxC [Alteribacter lacisalsi]|uniref:putative sporulation protein YtxC n=1 Tax=Alteribacter lacisalsi TaxID=2045244 RepID=UPI001374AF66|nr:putative sporulation protein YtxC [Alteribacter lacisalsi]
MVTIEFETKHQCRSCFSQLKTSLETFDQLKREVFLSRDEAETRIHIVLQHTCSEERMNALSILAAVMANYTLKRHLPVWLEEVVRCRFFYDEPGEAETIIAIARELLAGEHTEIQLEKSLPALQRSLYTHFYTVLKETEQFSYASFIQFRLRELKDDLVECVEWAIDEFKMEQEYQMMVDACRDYLKENQPLFDAVHVNLDDEPASFYDDDGTRFSNNDILDLLDDEVTFDGSLPVSERIISPLVSMAPEKLNLYCSGNEDEGYVIRTLLAIFEERVTFCQEPYRKHQ